MVPPVAVELEVGGWWMELEVWSGVCERRKEREQMRPFTSYWSGKGPAMIFLMNAS